MYAKVRIQFYGSLLGVAVAGTVAIACASDPPGTGAASADVTGATSLVISQVYASGGTTDDGFDSDYVEVFNRGTKPASMKDLSVAYYPKVADGGRYITMYMPEDDLQPGQHYLLKITVPGTKGKPLPSFDYRSPQFSSEDDHTAAILPDGFIALIATARAPYCSALGRLDECDAIDLVAIGDAQRKEGTAIASIPDGMAMYRTYAGCVDTNDNAADFVSGLPAPRSMKDPATPCFVRELEATDASADAAVDGGTLEPDGGADAGGEPPPAKTDAGAKPVSATQSAPTSTSDDRSGQHGAIGTAESTPTTTKGSSQPVADAASTCAMGTGPARSSLLGSLGLGLALAAFVRRRRPAP